MSTEFTSMTLKDTVILKGIKLVRCKLAYRNEIKERLEFNIRNTFAGLFFKLT